MEVLITGTGFVGSNAADRFLAEGESVVGLDIQPRKVDFLENAGSKFVTVQGDVRNPEDVEAVFTKHTPKVIVHTAIFPASTEPFKLFDINARGTATVLEAARKHDTRVVFISSGAIYGQIDDSKEGPVDEDEPLGPMFPMRPQDSPWAPIYCQSKRVCETWSGLYRDLYGMEIVSLRLGWVYGRGEVGRHMNTGLPLLLRKALAGEPFHVPQGGDTFCEFVEVRDVADAIFRAATVRLLRSSVYNIAYEKGYMLKEAAKIVNELVPNSDIALGPGLWPSKGVSVPRGSISWPTIRKLSIERAKKELGYRPTYDLKRGLEEYKDWIKKNWDTCSPMAVPFIR